jgi:uncharacterized protein YdcH (DUF465 family)
VHEIAVSAESLPHRTKYLRLAAAFFERIVDAHEQLVADVERELEAETSSSTT